MGGQGIHAGGNDEQDSEPPQTLIKASIQTMVRGSAVAAWMSSGRVNRRPILQPMNA
jgi:hypothetical protein